MGWRAGTSQIAVENFQQHNDQLKTLVGTEYSPATLERYQTSLKHTFSFIQWKFGATDIDIRKLDFEFMADYEFWLKSIRKCNHNSAIKYLGNFRKIVNKCIRNGWLAKDPFVGFKMTKREVTRNFLLADELNVLANKRFVTERLNQVRNIFLFNILLRPLRKVKNDSAPWPTRFLLRSICRT